MRFSFEQERRRRPLHTRKRRFVMRDMAETPSLFEDKEATFLDPERGAETLSEISCYQAGCGHVVGFQGPSELISSCGYCKSKSLCFRCGDLRCRRCLKILCQDCVRLLDETTVYCPPCRNRVVLKRAALRLLENLHALLSAEIK